MQLDRVTGKQRRAGWNWTALAATLGLAAGCAPVGVDAPGQPSVEIIESGAPAAPAGTQAPSPALAKFGREIHRHLRTRRWRPSREPLTLSSEALRASLAAGRGFLLRSQRPEGNFNYLYDFVADKQLQGDSAVRQGGALWALTLIHLREPSQETREAIERGLAFFFKITQPSPAGGVHLDYPGRPGCQTGAVAMLCLALTDYLRAERHLGKERQRELEGRLRGYLAFLLRQERRLGGFHHTYWPKTGIRETDSSPYYDGEALLALCRAARHLGFSELRPVIERQAPLMAEYYTLTSWKKRADSKETKGFFHWGIMAFWEYVQADWPNSRIYADTILSMAWWMIHTHRVLERTRNTGYAFEGLIPAYALARQTRNQEAAGELRHVIDVGLRKLSAWQVAGPLADENPFLMAHPNVKPLAVGGVMGRKDDPRLRVDITQHQMNAIMLALRHVYGE